MNINEQPKDPDCESPDYRARRMRAATTGDGLMMKKRNIKHYYGFDEEVKEWLIYHLSQQLPRRLVRRFHL